MSNAFSRAPSETSRTWPFPVDASPLQILGHSGTFDAFYYVKTNPDLKTLGTAVLQHYHQHGWREGRKPNPFFDPHWYLSQNRDVIGDPLLHYVLRGEREGRRPIAWFDPVWYARTYPIPEGMLALAHYLLNRHNTPLRPIPEFDPDFYLRSYPDVANAGLDALEHYMIQGFREARKPFDGFDPLYYRRKYLRHSPDSNPLLHYLENRNRPDVHPSSPETEISVFGEIKRRSKPGPLFEKTRPLPKSAIRRARVLAYYLPQFHTIPENDAWWGEGFTEWTNLPRGIPRFSDHYQPRIPRDLGHYTLNSPEILERQAAMAHAAGIEGFIFYFYWFNRKRLLDQPLEILLANPQIELPFCLMWANENWSRRWDGSENDLLIAQDYRPEDDEALVDCFARYLRDSRYIHFDGRPVLMVYRPGTIPDAPAAFARWRSMFRSRHGMNPLFVMGQAFGDENPDLFGLDGAIEFPPHKVVSGCNLLNDEIRLYDNEFSGQIYDYGEVVDVSLAQPKTPFPLIRTAAPSWDNDARRQGKGLVLHGSTPELYERWLSGLIEQAQTRTFFGDPVVCINAWNEWAEGAYLEPDQHFGSAYLNATARACTGFSRNHSRSRLLLIGHDAFPAGAQRLLLETGRTLKRSFGADIQFILLADGALLDEYRSVAPTEILSPDTATTTARLTHLQKQGFQSAIINSAASSSIVADLAAADIGFVFLIHELPALLRSRNLTASMENACARARHAIVPAESVARKLGLDGPRNLKILPQGLYNSAPFSVQARQKIRKQMGFSLSDRVIMGAGYADLRKGFDLFLQLWRKMDGRTHYIWLGNIDIALKNSLHVELETALSSGTFHMPGQVEDVPAWLAAADVFVLPSREDPYPSVVLEALASGLPCIAFDDAGGIPDLLRDGATAPDTHSRVVPFADVPAMTSAAEELAEWSLMRPARERQKTARAAQRRFSFKPYANELLSLALPAVPKISVVVPSHNYARYMSSRLSSIFAQTVPVLEVIVLDDASDDNSLEIARQTARDWDRDITCIENTVASGSVFRQWHKALKVARGDWIWIAEADDFCEPDFLQNIMDGIKDNPSVVMAFTDSRAVDENGSPIFASYRAYYAESAGLLLENDSHFTGESFLRGCLSERNLVLNVSSALFRKESLLTAIKTCQKDLQILRVAGDWRIYLELLSQKNAEVIYIAKPLNIHRRHADSATHTLNRRNHVEEITYMHGLIASRLALPETQISRQKRYCTMLERQFGLVPKTGANKTISLS
ncbi:glycoside hydrolase family 99-like domain-containing protein [Gluconobacter roseus]|uniref:glycoside hydrolase family 99-like domain-containing protein n=1 Tax=Gluconobacter roseus TaxID=586239 RepID=UPI0038D1E13A